MPEGVMKLGEFIKKVQRDIGKENCYMDGNIVFLNFNQNKHNCSESDCYCLCPMVEAESKRLSEAFCQCSVGYVCQMFLTHTGMKPEVELLESLKRGGKSCRFKITVP
jgi:hypothetical protein